MRRFARSVIAGTAALALAAADADAQAIGFKLGASMSNVSVEGTTGATDWTTAFMGGGFIRFGFGRLGIQPEILSVRKGAELDNDGTDDDAVHIEYIAVPVLLHLPLTYGASFAPYIIGGPEFAFDIGCQQSIAGGSDVDCNGDILPLETRRSVDIGLSAGGGFAFAVGPGALLLEGRYTWGMTNVNDSADEVEVRNRSAYILGGYSIPIGRRY
jgi:hypothetical protein